jgi:hypothetical protein
MLPQRGERKRFAQCASTPRWLADVQQAHAQCVQPRLLALPCRPALGSATSATRTLKVATAGKHVGSRYSLQGQPWQCALGLWAVAVACDSVTCDSHFLG